jgi:DNA invertase Pin-like site-specific DNA recombinase
VCYARFSTALQNERSCEQQFNTIRETIKRNRCPWEIIRTYQDDAVKGRLTAERRVGSGQMLRDIETGTVKPDLIVVDTWERFGRYEEAQDLRRKLEQEYGVLIVTADSNFSDPTGMQGKAIGLVENIRATEGNRVKSHDVVRGKKDVLRRGRWPGGPPPFGFRLNRKVEYRGNEPHHYSTLEHDPETIWIRQELMHKAVETGWGPTRLAKWLNTREDIPAKLKPFYDCTVKKWLIDSINIGVYVWNEHNTDIVKNTRVIEKNPDKDSIDRIEGFCPAVVERDVYEKVLEMSEARRRPKKDGGDGKIIKARSAGRNLEHPLTGLVVCECNAAMIASVSGGKSKTRTYHYVYRKCPRAHNDACDNHRYIREEDLEKAVFTRLRARLLPTGTVGGEVPAWFPEMVELVQQSVDAMSQAKPDMVAAKKEQIAKIEAKLQGWQTTLGQPDMPASVRADIIKQYDEAKVEMIGLQSELNEIEAAGQQLSRVVDPHAVLERLQDLDQLLSEDNPTLLNLELCKHIEEIRIDRNGKVVMRGTNLGVFDGGIELLSLCNDGTTSDPDVVKGRGFDKVRPRKRARRQVSSLTGKKDVSDVDAHRALDPERFAGLPDNFMWEEVFTIAPWQPWYKAYADRIYSEWLKVRNISELARRHDKTNPTVRRALNLGKKNAEAKKNPPS